MRGTNGLFAALTGATILAFAAAPAAAQVCAGQPTAPGQTSIGARASFPSGGTTLGVEASRNWMNPMGAFVSVSVFMPDAEGADNVLSFGGGLAYELPVAALPEWASLCPMAAITVGTGDVTQLTIPVGLGVGGRLAANGFEILPFAIPQFVFVRLSGDGETTTTSNFGIGFGAFAKFSGVYGGVSLNRIFEEGRTTDVSIHGGLVFPARLP